MFEVRARRLDANAFGPKAFVPEESMKVEGLGFRV